MLPQILRVETKEIPCLKENQGFWYRGEWRHRKGLPVKIRIFEVAGVGPMMLAYDIAKALANPAWKQQIAGSARELVRCGCGNSMPELPPSLREKVFFLDRQEMKELQNRYSKRATLGRGFEYGILVGIDFLEFWTSRPTIGSTRGGLKYLLKELRNFIPLSEVAAHLKRRNKFLEKKLVELEKRNAELEAAVAQLGTVETRNTQLEQMFTGILTACKTLNLHPKELPV